MKNRQQKRNDALFDAIHSKLPVLPHIKMSSILRVETDVQRMTGLGHMQLMREKLMDGRKACCPDSTDVSHLSSSVKDGKQEEKEHKSLPASKNSQGFTFNAYQKENHELIKTDDDLKHPGSINIQGQPQRHFTQPILESTSCPIFDQCQFGNPERYASFYLPKLGEANIDAIFSAMECVVPSDANHQEEQPGSIKKKKTVTFHHCMSAFSTSKRKRNIQQCSDMKMLVNPKCRTLKAKKPSISYILNIKGCASPNHRKESGCNLTTEMKEVEQGEKMADEMYSFMTITPDISRHNKVEREKDRSGEKRLSSNQVKQVMSLHKANVTSDDTKETNLQGEDGEESEQETLLKVVPQHGNFFPFCSDWEKELDLRKSENKRCEKTLFVTGQDIPQQMQPTDPLQVQEPKKSHQAQNGTIYTANSKLPLLKSKESLVGQFLIDTVNCGIPNIENLTGELYSRGEEEMPGFNENQQAAVPESLGTSTPGASESKRQRKTFRYTALKSKMSSKCVIMKAKKTRISQIFNIPGNGCLKNLPLKMLKPMIIGFLVHMEYFEALEDLSAERKEGLTQGLTAMVLESLDLSTLALPTSKRKDLKRIGKRNKMSPNCLTLKAKNALISQTFNITKCGVPRHRRQFKRNFKLMVEESIPVAAITLSAISSAMPISLDINMNDGIKVETDMPWNMSLSHELQQREQLLDGERTSWASSNDRRDDASNNMNKIKVQGKEAALNPPHFSFNPQKMKETHVVNSDLELKNAARKTVPDSVTIARELQQHALYTQHVLYSISHSILNLLPFEMLPKTTETQPGLKDTRSLTVSPLMPGQSVSAPFAVTAQWGIPFEKSSIPGGKIRLEKDLPEFFNFSMPASPDFKGQRNVAQIPKSRSRKSQMVLKSIKITRSDAPSHGKQWDGILENTAKEISLGMSNMFINTSLSSSPVSPAIKMHQKVTAKKGPLRKKSNMRGGWKQGERKRNKGKRLCTCSCNKRSASNTTLESRRQSEDNGILFKAGLPFLNRVGSRKDQNMLIAEQEVQPQTLVSENTSTSICSPLMIPFQMETLKKNIPPQNNILHKTGEKVSCPKSGKAICDDFLIDETGYGTLSDGSPARKLDVHSAAVSLQPKEKEEDIDSQKVITYTIDQNIPPPKSGNLEFGDPCDGISRRKVGDHTANEYEELQRDSLTMSMASVLFESKRQEKVLAFPVRKILAGPTNVSKKTKKPVCSHMHPVTEHSSLYCRREQECNFKSTIKDMQQSKSIVNAFSSPTPFSSESKRHIEMYSTVKAETDQQLEKSLHYREAQKSSSTDTQKRSSYTVKMNVQQDKEVRVGMINFLIPKHQEKETQGSKETQALTSLPRLPHLKLVEETQRISNTGEIVHMESIGGDIMKDVQNKKQPMPQEEDRDRGKTVSMRGVVHTADTGLKSKTSPPSYTLHRTELYVHIGRQDQKKHEDQGKPPDTVLRKVPISSPPTNLKLDKGTQVDEEELTVKGPPLFPQEVSALSDAEEIEDTETPGGDVRKRKQHLSQEEKDRERNRTKVDRDLLEITGVFPPQLQLPESSGAASIQYADSSKGLSAWTVTTKANRHRPHKDGKGRVEIEDGKGGILPQTITLREETCPLKHILGRNRLPLIKEQVTDVQRDKGKPKMVLRKTCASLPSPSHLKWVASVNEMEDTLRTTQSCFPPLRIQDLPNGGKRAHTKSFEGHMLKEEDRPQEYFEDKMLPIYTDLEAKKLLLPHILNAKELQCKIKEQKRKVQASKNKLITNVKNICTSLLTLPYHMTFDTTEEEGCRVMVTKVPLPPAQSKASSDRVEIARAETTDGELSWDMKALKEEKDREKNMNTNRMVDAHDMDLNAKKSPILLVYNLSGLQRKTKKREVKVQKVACEPSGVMLTKTCTPSSSPLHLDMNIGIKDKSMPTSTRSSVSPVNSQESSDSEEVVYGEPMTCGMFISPQEGKQHMPQNKKEVGVQTRSPTFPEHQGKKMHARKDEKEAEMQRGKEYDFCTQKKTALWSEDDSAIFIRSLSVSVMSPPQTEETVESETNLEREKRLCLSQSPPKSPNASDTVKRNNSSTVKKGGQDFTNLVPEDSQPFMVDQKQMQNLPSVTSEENLSSEVNKKCLTPRTEKGVVLGHISRIIKESYLLIIEQEEKAPKPILTPTEHPGMSADPKENTETHIKSILSMNTSPAGAEDPPHETQPVDTVECACSPEHRDQSEPTQDTTTLRVQGQTPSSGTVPRPPQVKSNEIKIVADSMCAETLPILCEAIKNVFESQIKNMTQDKVYADTLEKVKACYPHDWKSPPFSRSPDTTSTTIHPKLQPKTMLESKALEIKLNLIPKMAKQSSPKFNFYPKRTSTDDNNQRFHPRPKNMKFLSLEEVDTIQLNLKHKYQKDSPHVSCMKTMTVDVSRGSKEIIAKLNSISKLESRTSSVTPASKTPLSQILQNYSAEEKDKLLIHFAMKTLEIQMKAFPGIVRESRTMADTQHRRKPLCKCIHLGVQAPKHQSNQSNRILLLFEEKSLHQIELDLQCKYLRFRLGFPVQTVFPRPNRLPKHFLMSNTDATCEKTGNSGESGSLSPASELLEQRVSFKKGRPHENSSLIRRFVEPTPVCASGPERPRMAQRDTTVLPVLTSHVTLEKDKHHVWFQETETRRSFDLKIKSQENAPPLVDYHSIQISQDFTGSQTDMESSANLEECSSFEIHDSEESIFLEANPYLNQESENILSELQKGIPLENFYKVDQIKTGSKPGNSNNSVSLPIRGCRKSSSAVTPPSQESHHSRKHGSPSKMQSPVWRRHSSLNALEVALGSSCIPFSEEKLPWITKNRAGYSLAPLTESNIKLHLAKSQDKPHRQPESKERKKAKCGLFGRHSHEEDGDHSCTQRQEKHRRKKKVCGGESERTDDFPSKYKSAAKPPQEDISLHSGRKQNPPFFYACVPADSLEIIPQTIRWTIPPKTLRKRNFRVPLLAEVSSSFNV